MVEKIVKTEKEWQQKLTPEQFQVCRQAGTEQPFSGKFNNFKEKGTFVCVCCGSPLFNSETKFDSGTGWPSFFDPISDQSIELNDDWSMLMRRVEVKCAKCDAHLGHVFDDGPPTTQQRYCMNSLSLDFKKKEGTENS